MKTALLGIALAAIAFAGSLQAAPEGCDRRCMSVALDRYVAALIAHDAKGAPLDAKLRSTENALPVAVGAGLWRSLTGLGPMQRRYFDPVSHQAALYGIAYEASGPALLSLRVKFEGTRIVESEAIVARKGEPLFNPAGAVADQPRAEHLATAPKPSTRVDARAAPNAYFDALQGGNARKVPKVPGCERTENGTRVTHRPAPPPRPGAPAATAAEAMSGDCTQGIDKLPISAVAHRRFPVIDTEAGVILGVGIFERPKGATWADGSPRKRNLLHEYFTLDGGRITGIFAAMHYLDASDADSSGW